MSPRRARRRPAADGKRATARASLDRLSTGLRRLFGRNGLDAALSIVVIGLTLALPMLLLIVATAIERHLGPAETHYELTVFLEHGLAEPDVDALTARLAGLAEVSEVTVTEPAAALEELRALADLGSHEDSWLTEANPLPYVLGARLREGGAAGTGPPPELRARILEWSGVDDVQFNGEWLARVRALTRFADHLVTLVGGLLVLTALLVVSNTVRVAVTRRQREIVVARLVGADIVFIARPFVLAGLAYGLLGAGLAWILLSVVLAMLAEPFSTLVGEPGLAANGHLGPPGWAESAAVFAVGMALGALGSLAGLVPGLVKRSNDLT